MIDFFGYYRDIILNHKAIVNINYNSDSATKVKLNILLKTNYFHDLLHFSRLKLILDSLTFRVDCLLLIFLY
jgi:hypothetical protein